MGEDKTTTEMARIEQDIQTNINSLENDVTQKNNRIMELEHDVSEKDDDITDLKRELDD